MRQERKTLLGSEAGQTRKREPLKLKLNRVTTW